MHKVKNITYKIMQQYKIDFINFLVEQEALKFGNFTLKSGRQAPYFLNMGSFYTGESIAKLAGFYAEAFLSSGFDADTIFGPAYKGIPLATAVVEVLFSKHNVNLKYSFNRKEVKDHGEGSLLVGAPLSEDTKLVIIDDVITAGTAIRDSLDILKLNGNPVVAGVLIALDRKEKNNEGRSAIADVAEMINAPVVAIVNIDEVIEVLSAQNYFDEEKLSLMMAYRQQYGV